MWLVPVILALGRWLLEDQKFKASEFRDNPRSHETLPKRKSTIFRLGVVACVFNFSTQEAEAGGLIYMTSSRLAKAT